MALYYCQLTLHDNIFFASREMGILYETEKYLHNWALSYAFFKGTYIPHPYRLQGEKAQTPDYLDSEGEQSLAHLNRLGVYVFPAKPVRWSYQINTFKAAQTNYYGKPKQFGDKEANRNYPINYGRAKELAVGSEYYTFLIAPKDIKIPHWIRVGKWLAKVEVKSSVIPEQAISQKTGLYNCDHPLNPVDLPANQHLLLYNRIVMPPVSLVSQSQLEGNYWELSKDILDLPQSISLPIGVSYGASITN
ncbi:type I-D CRISPR-associated protein Cas5/Csc1 [Gloeocapsa sp. PCC 73106]|uniref:type I-D CRISPR-associated protein Cas5/Csc1 n=1 Tax=Gloeocapsa sp. PCC 73106 TaxID=102232 RepID=UPI0002AC5905|nr:type I-D CRISPR-associated protein Cas5/Csc1 [Gloeocapsa sp. PCC 73106]ELR97241.1 CRISPR type I-D/CYANO-associated protein Csc1 [Gloeocapsa sp. PCC 73106]